MHISLQQLAQALGGEVKGAQVLAPGPGHSPKDRSMAVRLDSAGEFIVNSFSGDDWTTCRDHIRAKLGMPPFEPRRNGKANGHHNPPAPKQLEKTPHDAAARRAAATARMNKVLANKVDEKTAPPSTVTATYSYRAADGTLLYQVLRLEPKSFRQRRPDGSSGWVNGLGDTPRVPFRLPEMLADDAATVFLTEGEKDALRLTDLFLCATTLSGGTRWTEELTGYFRGRDVVIVPDHDAAGAKKAMEAADALHGVAASIRVVFLPGLTGAAGVKDASDWLDQDPARADVFAQTCLAAPLWTPGAEVERMAAAVAVVKGKETEITRENSHGDELGERDAGVDHGPIPPRAWLLGNVFCRRFASSLIAEGGVGKTALRYAQYMALATGKNLTGEHVFQRSRVLIVSLEDDLHEVERRLAATRLHHGVERVDCAGWLYTAAPGAAGGKLMHVDQRGKPAIGSLAIKLAKTIAQRQIDLVALDPFVKAHSIEENSNSQVDDVMQVLTDLAVKFNIAVDLPHHMSKGSSDPGNASRGRGASSMKDAARLVYSLSPMTPEEAQAFGLGEAERRSLVRMDSAKVNIAPPMTEAKWFRLVGVNLGNGSELYPSGDQVQTVAPWNPPETFDGLNNALLNEILTDIESGLRDGNRYTEAPHVTERAAWRVIEKHCPSKSEAACRQIIKLWLKSGLLVRREYENPVTRKTVKGLYVDHTKRPS